MHGFQRLLPLKRGYTFSIMKNRDLWDPLRTLTGTFIPGTSDVELIVQRAFILDDLSRNKGIINSGDLFTELRKPASSTSRIE